MIETIVSHPATWAILGILVKTFAPAAVPFLGAGKKLVKELIELHDYSDRPNVEIKAQAIDLELHTAAKHLRKRLKS